MKYSFRKIASVLASVIMVSSTVGMAAAANYPAPFVKDGSANVAIVYDGDLNLDSQAAIDIQSNLASALGAGTSSSGSTVQDGDSVKLQRSTDMFNLGNNGASFYTTLDDGELSQVLKSGVYQNDNNDEYDYEQEIALGNLTLEHFQDSDFNDDKPAIGIDLSSGAHILNYTLDFTPDPVEGGVNFGNLETTDLTLLGRTYYIVSATNTTATNLELTLLDTANTAIVTDGETSTIKVGDKSYEVSISFIDSNDVILSVNGVSTNKLSEGDVFKVADDTFVAVKNNLYNNKDTGISKVEISLGSGKITLKHATELKINNDAVSENSDSVVKTFFTLSGNDLDKIVLEWNLDDDAWLAKGSDLILPGFETIKLSMGDFVTPKSEVTKIQNDGDDSIQISTALADGPVTFNLLYSNSSKSGFAGLGKKSTQKLVTSNGTNPTIKLNETENSRFVATWISGDDAESYLLEISGITDNSGKNQTEIRNVASGKTITLKNAPGDAGASNGDSADLGRITITSVGAVDSTKNASIRLTSSGSGNVYSDRVVTAEGLMFKLPVADTTTAIAVADTWINVSNNDATWRLNFTEEDKDGNIGAGANFSAVLGFSSEGAQVSSVSKTTYSNANNFETEDGSDNYVGYVRSDLATKTLYKTGGDQDTLEITYAGEEAYGEVFVAEAGAAIVSTGGLTQLGNVLVKDSEASGVSKNLIVVGGSCVNSVAADLLGGALCGPDFEQATGVGANSFLIQTFSRSGGNIATLVAGYSVQDTANAAKYLTTQTVDTSSGKKYKGSSATQAVLV